MERAGKVSPGQQAHHIVEIGDPAAQATRGKLSALGIDIDDVANGVGLTNHCGCHSRAYSNAVQSRIAQAKDKKQALAALDEIGRELSKVDKEISAGTRGDKSATEGWTADQTKGKRSNE